ncbi:MAG: hypothetical protein AB7F28_05385 [Candidatus Margulisiibacteriota bacterium]
MIKLPDLLRPEVLAHVMLRIPLSLLLLLHSFHLFRGTPVSMPGSMVYVVASLEIITAVLLIVGLLYALDIGSKLAGLFIALVYGVMLLTSIGHFPPVLPVYGTPSIGFSLILFGLGVYLLIRGNDDIPV